MDIPAGRFDKLSRPVSCDFNRLSFLVRFDNTNLDPEEKWFPAASAYLSQQEAEGPYKEGQESAILRVAGRPAGAPPVVYFLKSVGTALSQPTMFGTVPFGQEFPVTLSWNEKNEVTVQVAATEPATIALSGPPLSVNLSVSGASARFSDIKSTSAGAAPKCAPASESRRPDAR